MNRSRLALDPVWGLVVGLGALAALLVAGPVASAGTPSTTLLAWWSLAPLYALGEIASVRIPTRIGGHEVNLAEVATVLGLSLAAPLELPLAFVLGVVPVRLLRRSAPIKLAFNVANGLVELTVAMTLTRLVVGPDDFGVTAWAVTAGAVVVASLLTTFTVGAAITLHGGSFDLREVEGTFVLATTVSAANVSLALAAVSFLREERIDVVLCIVPLVVLYTGYRGLISEQQHRHRTETLHRTTELLGAADRLDEVLPDLLSGLQEGLRTGRVTLGLRGDRAVHHTVEKGKYRTGPLPPPTRVAAGAPGRVGLLGATIVDGDAVLELHDDGVAVGVLTATRRPDPDDHFTEEDLALLTTIGTRIASELVADELSSTVDRMRDEKDALEHQAHHDPLTGLPNRRLLQRRLDAALDPVTAASRDGVVTLLFADLDDFKSVNDLLGHHLADRVLVELGARLRAAVRPEDVPGRLGGDEFAVLLAGEVDASGAQAVADRVRRAFGEPLVVDGRRVGITASIGLAEGRVGRDNVEDLLTRADRAMYSAKIGGKNRVERFRSEVVGVGEERAGLRNDLAVALERCEIDLALQPVIDLRTGRVEGAEALARWHHPERGPVPPSEFVPLAESAGLIGRLGGIVLDKACAQARVWRDAVGPTAPAVSVNVSALELSQPGFVRHVAETLDAHGLEPGALTLEIVERILLPHESNLAATLMDLHDLGVRLALDDFGTGYSSLSYLRWLPVDDLKIDRTFTAGVTRPGPDRAVIESVITLGASLGLRVVAEGIETAAQLDALRELGCEVGQGYLTGRPTEASADVFTRRR